MMGLSKVRKWDETDALSEAFSEALENFFYSVYIPVKIPTQNGMPDEYTYENVGLSDSQLAIVYGQLYGANYLVDPLVLVSTDPTDYATSIGRLAKRIKAVLFLNKTKYLKLIEVGGYEWNPMWNVDGTEEYTFLENQGINDVTNTAKIGTVTGKTNTYDGTLRDATQTSYGTVGNGNNNQESETTYTHNNAKNLDSNNQEKDYTATSAFGESIIGGDKFHTEKRIRQGNIGVTKTTELLNDAREYYRQNIIGEFFKDINQQILVGVYD